MWAGWGYPYLLPSFLDYPDEYGSEPYQDYGASQQPGPEYAAGPYAETPPSQPSEYTPWPYGSQTAQNEQHTAPSGSETSSPPPPPETPVTLVFKDGRPPEQIRNYLLTATTLSVLDQHRRDIPVDQIDLAATARANRETGVDFSSSGGNPLVGDVATAPATAGAPGVPA